MNPTQSSVSLACTLSALALSTSCVFSSRLALRNETQSVLVPYPVVTSPPPPHREADPASSIAVNALQEIDTEGFNPVYYAPGVSDPGHPNGLFVGLGLYEDDPPLIQTKVFHHLVPPGEEVVEVVTTGHARDVFEHLASRTPQGLLLVPMVRPPNWRDRREVRRRWKEWQSNTARAKAHARDQLNG